MSSEGMRLVDQQAAQDHAREQRWDGYVFEHSRLEERCRDMERFLDGEEGEFTDHLLVPYGTGKHGIQSSLYLLMMWECSLEKRIAEEIGNAKD